MSQNALTTTVMLRASFSVSFLAERICKGNRVGVQLKTVVRISHHCGFAGTSQTTTPGLSPVTSCTAICKSPSSSTFSSTTRPVSANRLFSIPVRSDCIVKAASVPGQPNMSDGVTACIALASTGGGEGPLFTDYSALG